MALAPQAMVVAALVAAAVLGVALGAELQKETFLHPERLADIGSRDAASNLIVLTAFIPALCLGAAAALLGTVPWRRRIGPALALGGATYLLIVLLQSSWPNYDAVAELRVARFSITPLISNGHAVPSTFLGPIAVVVGLGLGARAAFHRLLPGPQDPSTPHRVLHRFLGAYALAVPFLAVAVAGNLRLLVDLPDEQARTAPYLIVFPLAALAALGLLVTGAIKAWHLGAFVRNGRLADAADQAWEALRRVEWALAGVLGGLAVLATALPAIDSPLLEAGRTFAVTTRGHAQFHLLLALPLLPWFLQGPSVHRMFAEQQGHAHTLAIATHPLVVMQGVVAGAAVVLAIVMTWLVGGALWPWAAACLPVLVLVGFLPARHAMAPALTLAVVLWGIGNSIVGAFALREDTALTVETAPGVLSLLRVTAVLVVAWAVARRVRASRATDGSIAWPLAIVIAAACALVIFLEGSFTAWIAPTIDGEFVGIGSLVASLDKAVRVTIHVTTSLAGIGAGVAVARLWRPDWFGRAPPEPLDAPLPAAT